MSAFALLAAGCHSIFPSKFWPSSPGKGPVVNSAVRIPLGEEWSAPPVVIERAFRAPLEFRAAEDVEHGQTRTKRLRVYSPSEDLEFEIKWKAAKPSLDGINNAPRREIAAYEIQRLVLDPADYVVPTTSLLCLDPRELPGALGEPNVKGFPCVVGAVSLWLQNVRYPTEKINLERFAAEPVYAYHAANLNLVAILMDHSDTHSRNLLVSQDASSRRMYSIDNGISFNSWFRSPFSRDWNRLRVPALRAVTVERLRALKRGDLDYLSVVAELRADDSTTQASSEGEGVLNPNRGVRVADGVVQVGLTAAEIDGVWRRRQRILDAVDQGKVGVF